MRLDSWFVQRCYRPANLASSFLLLLAINILLQCVASGRAVPVPSGSAAARWNEHYTSKRTWDLSRAKRSGISDQRLAELVELARMEMIRKLIRDNSRDGLAAYGLIDPAVIGRRRRRRDLPRQ